MNCVAHRDQRPSVLGALLDSGAQTRIDPKPDPSGSSENPGPLTALHTRHAATPPLPPRSKRCTRRTLGVSDGPSLGSRLPGSAVDRFWFASRFLQLSSRAGDIPQIAFLTRFERTIFATVGVEATSMAGLIQL